MYYVIYLLEGLKKGILSRSQIGYHKVAFPGVEELNIHHLTPSLSVAHFMELSASFSTAIDDRVKIDRTKRNCFPVKS
jgi:hypothetical protein